MPSGGQLAMAMRRWRELEAKMKAQESLVRRGLMLILNRKLGMAWNKSMDTAGEMQRQEDTIRKGLMGSC